MDFSTEEDAGKGGHINRGPKTDTELTDTEAELTGTEKFGW